MRIRYISYLSLGAAAAFLVVATYGFSLSTIDDLTFGVAIAMLVVSLGVAVRYRDDLRLARRRRCDRGRECLDDRGEPGVLEFDRQ